MNTGFLNGVAQGDSLPLGVAGGSSGPAWLVPGPQAPGARRTQACTHGGSLRGAGAEHGAHRPELSPQAALYLSVTAGSRHRPNQLGTPPRRGSGLWRCRCSSSTWSRRSSSAELPPGCFPLGNRSGNVKVCPCAWEETDGLSQGPPRGGPVHGETECPPHATGQTHSQGTGTQAGPRPSAAQATALTGPFSLRLALAGVSALGEPSKTPTPGRSCQARLQARGQGKRA